MYDYLNKWLNYGVDVTADIEEIKRIRIYNFFLLVQVTLVIIVGPFMLFDNFSIEKLLIFFIVCTGILIPLILNLFKKSYLSRVVNIILNIINVLIISLLFGPEVHAHYFLLVSSTLSFLWLPPHSKLRFILCFIAVLNWMILIGYHTTFSGDYLFFVEHTNLVKFINDFAIITFMISLFYITTREYDKQLEQVKLKSRQIEEKNIELERFSFIASHDLKEPLRTVQSFNDVIREEFGEKINEDLQTYFKFIDDALARMSAMIDGLLQYSRIVKSNEAVSVDLNVVMNDLKSDLSNLISSSKAIIQHGNLPNVVGGAIELRLLFQNLITNAIKFQQPNKQPHIEITSKNLPDCWQFCIADNGIGIEKKKHKEIFKLLAKLHATSKFEGQGMGLAFCKKVVEIHNGEIWVESVPDEGSRFYFTISKDNLYEKKAQEHIID